NQENGIQLVGPGVNSNFVKGNYIGTDADGAVSVKNRKSGILLDKEFTGQGPVGTIIGGTEDGAMNLISGNGEYGGWITGGASLTHVFGDLIGTTADGLHRLGNGIDGVRISEAGANIIGGETEAEQNVIGANVDSGVSISGNNATGNHVQRNLIGVGK